MDYFLGGANGDTAKLQKVFQKLDIDGSGYLTKNELKTALAEMGMTSSDQVVNEMFNSADHNKNGTISFDEFEKICLNKRNTFGSYAFANIAGFEMQSLGIEIPVVFGDEDHGPIIESAKVEPTRKAVTPPRPNTPEKAAPSRLAARLSEQKKAQTPVTPMHNVNVKVPQGAKVGQQVQFVTQSGRKVTGVVPKGARPGSVITLSVPKPPTMANKKPASSLTKEQVATAQAIFRRIDYDGSGSLDHHEVKMALDELGMDSSDERTDQLLQEFDLDGNGTIEMEEFKVIYANSAEGDIQWGHLDRDTIAKIERQANGVGQVHEGYMETVAFMRVLDKGIHFLRVDKNGVPQHTSLKLSSKRDAIKYQYTAGQIASFRLSTLWGVAEPFQDEHDDTMNLTPGPEYVKILPVRGGANAAKLTPTATRALALSDRHVDKRQLVEATRSRADSLIIIDSERAHAAMTGALTGVSPQFAAAAQGVGVSQPVTSAVLLLVADDVDSKARVIKGLHSLIAHHEHHALDANGNIKKSSSSSSLSSSSSSSSSGNGMKRVASFRKGEVDGKGAKSRKQGAITRFFHMFHHLYRPHHHPNHPPARYHIGIEAEVLYDESYSIVGVIKHGKGKKTKITEKKLKMPMPVFRPNMYVVATIKSFDRNEGTYDLTYSSGPYLADENPNGIHLFKGPEDASSAVFHFKGVKQSLITVDLFDNFGSHEPIFILLISLIQTGCFAYWVTVKDNNLGLYSPVSGPEWSWLRIMSDFPNCENLKTDYWRYASYQFVHNGIERENVKI